MEALGINASYLVAQILNFTILLMIMSFWVYKPVVELLQKRRDTIAKGIEDARIASEARNNAEKESEKVMADAQKKASDIVREASQRAEEATRDIKAAAEKGAGEARKEALVEVEAERDRLLGEVRSQIAALAMAATQKLIGEALDDKRQHVLIDEFFSGIKGGKVMVVDKSKGESAEVTSALPLTDKEQKTISNDVLGGKGEVTFKVDPSILGGLVVRVGDKVVDGSVAGKLDAMRQSVR